MSPELRNITAICLFFCLFGLGFASFGLYDLWQTHAFVTTAEHATGKVVGFESRHSHASAPPYPVYEFTDRNGQAHHVVSEDSSSADKYTIGSDIPLLYDPGDPNISRIGTFSHLYIFPLAFCGLGMLAVLISIGAYYSGYKSYKS